MKENSIEEAIERLEYIDRTYSCNNYYSIWDLKCIEILLSDYKRVLKENAELKNRLKEKDKIIDLMAEEISKNITNTCPFADYNYDLDCENKCNDNYKECWKQYFENKVKEG